MARAYSEQTDGSVLESGPVQDVTMLVVPVPVYEALVRAAHARGVGISEYLRGVFERAMELPKRGE